MKLLKNKYQLLFFLMLASGFYIKSQAQDSVAREMILSISYNMSNDHIPYLMLSAKEKVERKFVPLKDIAASLYMGEESASGFLGKVKTDSKGESKVFIPATLKETWETASPLKFIAVTEAGKEFESTSSEIEILKAKIEIDTSSDEESKSITVKLSEFKNGEWVPAQATDIKVVVKRLLGNLPVGEEETYTTDSSGMVTAEFLRDSLPGDSKGFLNLLARTDESELYGSISTEVIVPWGAVPVIENNFNQRSLWSTRFRTPIWLVVLAYSIMGGVWGTLIYLIWQLLKIRKMGRSIASIPAP
ncbi:MAG TPA: hypothetical protein VI548_04790 [Chitinophagaceae bacterium]|nr:hypothetical protein [Chitinophagaceae bacterium]